MEDERAEDESEDEYSEDLRKELAEDNNKIKAQMEIHREKSNQLGLMANYILECSSNVPIQSDKLKKYAREALNKIEKDEADWEENVDSWRRSNRKWLRPKKKEKVKE